MELSRKSTNSDHGVSAQAQRPALIGLLAALAVGFAGAASAIEHGEEVLRVEYAEPVDVKLAERGAAAGQSAPSVSMSFDAFGRHFALVLEPNEIFSPDVRIVRVTDDGARAEQPYGEFYRGHVEGEPGSWARVSVIDGVVEAVVQTVEDVYFVEPADRVAAGPGVGSESVAYRISDVSVTEPLTCGWEEEGGGTAAAGSEGSLVQSVYEALMAHLSGASAAGGPLVRTELAIAADYEFSALQSLRGQDPVNRVMSTLNSVDGIYQAQAGVTFQLQSLTVYETASDPFDTPSSPCTDHLELLYEFGRTRSSGQYPWRYPDSDVAHLFTGRDLCGTVIGVAWRPGVCDNYWGTGLSQDFNPALYLLTLLVAHEVGHNFSAVHDPTASCGQRYIMHPSLGSCNLDQFSTQSASEISSFAAGASCLDLAQSATPTPTPTPVPTVPPGVPSPQSPSGSIADTTPEFSWTAVSGATKYFVAAYDLTAGAYAIMRTVVGATTYTPSTPLDGTHTYKWKVRAGNDAGWGVFSGWLRFDYLSDPPAAPAPQSPSGTIADTTPDFQWAAVPGASKYFVAVYDVTAGAYAILQTVVGTTTYTPSVPLDDTHVYKWKVRAGNDAGWSAFSGWLRFGYLSGPPPAPAPRSPSGTIADTTPDFQWSAVSGASKYFVAVYDATAGAYTILRTVVGATTYTPSTPLDPEHAYKWKVRAYNGAAWGPYSSWMHFNY